MLIPQKDISRRIFVAVQLTAALRTRVPPDREIFGDQRTAAATGLRGSAWGDFDDGAASFFRFTCTQPRQGSPTKRGTRDMNCQNCQSVLPQGAIYCARCGTSQNITPSFSGQITQIPFSSPAESGWIQQPQVVQSSAKYDVITLEHQEHEANGQHEEEEKELEKEEDNERLMVFSDGIIAFALTVAAITIKIPTSAEELQANGLSIWLRVIMYIIAFIIVISAWADHHTIFHHIKRNNVTLVVLNFFYLAAIVMFPMGLFFTEFGLELTNTSPTLSQSQLLLGLGIFLGSQMLASLTLCRMWLYAKHRSRLLDTELDPYFSSYMTKRLIAKPVTFLFIVVVLILNFSVLPIITLLLIPIAFIARAIYFMLAIKNVSSRQMHLLSKSSNLTSLLLLIQWFSWC